MIQQKIFILIIEKTGGKRMKKLYKSSRDKKICGVCGGIAEYFNIDSTVVRLIFVIFGLVSVGVVFYILAALLMPQDGAGF